MVNARRRRPLAASEDAAFALFPTEIGWCAVVWSTVGIARVLLPEADPEILRRRLDDCLPGREATPPDTVSVVTANVMQLTRGRPVDLRATMLDWRPVPAFHRQVYEATQQIAPGETSTYGDVARRIGRPGAARAVGQALGRNPFAIVVPCHRVLAAGGRPGGFSAPGGLTTKRQLLAIETGALPFPVWPDVHSPGGATDPAPRRRSS